MSRAGAPPHAATVRANRRECEREMGPTNGGRAPRPNGAPYPAKNYSVGAPVAHPAAAAAHLRGPERMRGATG